MERINALIDKIYQLKEQGVSPVQILPTVQLLQSEIVKLQQKNGVLGTSKVAVIMPVQSTYHAEKDVQIAEVPKVEELMMPAKSEQEQKYAPQPKEVKTPILQEEVISNSSNNG